MVPEELEGLHLEAKDFIPMNAPVVVQVETCRMKSLQLGSGLNRGGHLVQTKIERAPIPASAWRIGAGLLGQYRRGCVKWIDEHHFSPFVRRPCCKSAQVSQVADTPTFLTAQGIQLDVPSPYVKVRREMTLPRADDHAHRRDLLIREGELVIADRQVGRKLSLDTHRRSILKRQFSRSMNGNFFSLREDEDRVRRRLPSRVAHRVLNGIECGIGNLLHLSAGILVTILNPLVSLIPHRGVSLQGSLLRMLVQRICLRTACDLILGIDLNNPRRVPFDFFFGVILITEDDDLIPPCPFAGSGTVQDDVASAPRACHGICQKPFSIIQVGTDDRFIRQDPRCVEEVFIHREAPLILQTGLRHGGSMYLGSQHLSKHMSWSRKIKLDRFQHQLDTVGHDKPFEEISVLLRRLNSILWDILPLPL